MALNSTGLKWSASDRGGGGGGNTEGLNTNRVTPAPTQVEVISLIRA